MPNKIVDYFIFKKQSKYILGHRKTKLIEAAGRSSLDIVVKDVSFRYYTSHEVSFRHLNPWKLTQEAMREQFI